MELSTIYKSVEDSTLKQLRGKKKELETLVEEGKAGR